MSDEIENLDSHRESDDTFSFSRSAENAPATSTTKRNRQREKKDWRLRHLAEK
jgi:hypothetical protein